MNHHILSSCIEDINLLLLSRGYIIKQYNEEIHKDTVTEFSSIESDCMVSVFRNPGLLIYQEESNELAGYLFFSCNTTSLDIKPYIGLDLSCTAVKYRRKGLSTYLRMVCFIYAIRTKQKYIASDVNKDSLKLLQKFGFNGAVGEFIENFEWYYTAFVDVKSDFFLEKVRSTLHSLQTKS